MTVDLDDGVRFEVPGRDDLVWLGAHQALGERLVAAACGDPGIGRAPPERRAAALQHLVRTDLPGPEEREALIALGAFFGDLVAERLGLVWGVRSDAEGRDLCLRVPGSDLSFFPLSMLLKRVVLGTAHEIDAPYWLAEMTDIVARVGRG